MWRFLQSLPRSARTFRPSQYCSQDNGEDLYGQIPSSVQTCNDASLHTSSRHTRKPDCCTVKLSKWVSRKYPKSGDSNPRDGHRRHKFNWIWAVSCETYPHLSECLNKEEEEKWRRFKRRQMQILQRHFLLNAVGWGSLAVFTWSLCQYLRSCSLIYNSVSHPNSVSSVSHQNSVNNVSESSNNYNKDGAGNEVNNTYFFKFDSEVVYSNEVCDSDFISKTFSQNLDELISSESDIDSKQVLEIHENIKSLFVNLPSEHSIPELFLYSNIFEENKDYLHSQVVEIVEDSGFIENLRDNKEDSQNSELKSSVTTESTQSHEDWKNQGITYIATCGENAQSDNNVSLNGSAYDSCQDYSESSQIETESSSDFETVTIKECGHEDSSESDESSSGGSLSTETESSSPTQCTDNVSASSLDGRLQEVIESGKESIDSFSTELVGVLEERMNHHVARNEPGAALPYFNAGALLGDASSNYNLALCYHMGHGVEQDIHKAKKLYEAASRLGHGWATYNLAVMLMEGQGGPRDIRKARSLLIKAANGGVKEAKVALQQMSNLKNKRVISTSHKQSNSSTYKKSEPFGQLSLPQRHSDSNILEDFEDFNVFAPPDRNVEATRRPSYNF